MSTMALDPSRLLANPLEFPQEFKSWLADYVAMNVPRLPVSQVFGFDLEKVKSATVDTEQGTSTTSYTALATAGPLVSNLANGFYIAVFGADVKGDGWMSISLNGATAQDADGFLAAGGGVTWNQSDLRWTLIQLTTNDLNSVECKYKASAGTPTWAMRYLHLFKVLNVDV